MIRVVEAKSVEDYLQRYYKPERMTSTLLASYQKELERDGYVSTSHHDNVLGVFICWPYAPEWWKSEADFEPARGGANRTTVETLAAGPGHGKAAARTRRESAQDAPGVFLSASAYATALAALEQRMQAFAEERKTLVRAFMPLLAYAATHTPSGALPEESLWADIAHDDLPAAVRIARGVVGALSGGDHGLTPQDGLEQDLYTTGPHAAQVVSLINDHADPTFRIYRIRSDHQAERWVGILGSELMDLASWFVREEAKRRDSGLREEGVD